MRLRLSVFLRVGVSIAVLFLIIHRLLTSVLNADFLDLERREVQDNVQRAEEMLANKEDELAVKASGWSQRDDTYRFIGDQNQAYIESNLNDESFLSLHINVMAFVDSENRIVFEKSIDDAGTVMPFPPELAAALVPGSPFLDHPSLVHVSKGLLPLPEGVLVVASRPITSSVGTAPAQGTVLFGTYIDEAVTGQLSQLTHLELGFEPWASPALPSDFSEARKVLAGGSNAGFILPEADGKKIAGFGVMNDLYGRPVLLVKALSNRDVYEKGQTSLWFFTKLLLVEGVVFIVVILLLSEWLVLKKLLRLNREVDAISHSQDIRARVTLPGTDEFSQLADSINRMLTALGTLQSKKKESEMRFRTVADTAPVMIWMADETRGFTYFNKGWLTFTGRAVAQELGEGWFDSLYPEDRTRFEQAWREAFRLQAPFRVEYRLRRADGIFRWILTNGVPNYSSEQAFLGYLGASIDITERREADERKERYIGEVERLNRLMIERELKMMELKKRIQELETRHE